MRWTSVWHCEKYGCGLRIYRSTVVLLSDQLEINSAKIVVYICSWFSLVDCGPFAYETVWRGKRSIVYYRFLFILVYFVTVCGIAALPKITFLLTSPFTSNIVEAGI